MAAGGRQKKGINVLLLVCTIAAGLCWGIVGERLLASLLDSAGYVLAAGLYYAALFAVTVSACLLSESVVSSLTPRRFFTRYTLPSVKYLFPIAVAVFFGAACLLQFLYGLESAVTNKQVTVYAEQKTAKAVVKPQPKKQPKAPQITTSSTEMMYDDFYFIVDDSSSMTWESGFTGVGTDPQGRRIALINRIVEKLPETTRVMLARFADDSEILLKLSYCTPETKRDFAQAAKQFTGTWGGTDIIRAVQSASSQLDAERRGIALLITDGISKEYDLEKTIQPYVIAHIPVYSVLLGDTVSPPILHMISEPTSGKVIAVDNFEDFEKEIIQFLQVEDLVKADSSIETGPETGGITQAGNTPVTRTVRDREWKQVRHILLPRSGTDPKAGSAAYAVFRVGITLGLGLFLGLGIALVFGYLPLMFPFAMGGALSGLTAGSVLETWLQSAKYATSAARIVHDIILAAVLWTIAWLVSLIFSGGRSFEWFVTCKWREDETEKLQSTGMEDVYKTIGRQGDDSLGIIGEKKERNRSDDGVDRME